MIAPNEYKEIDTYVFVLSFITLIHEGGIIMSSLAEVMRKNVDP